METFRIFSKKDGLPNDKITGILEDNKKNLWLSTYKGLSRFSLSDFSVKNFYVLDGLETDEFLTPGGFKNKEGEIYFGGRKGLICISQDEVKYNTYKPPVYLTDFKLFNQSIYIGPSIPLRVSSRYTNYLFYTPNYTSTFSKCAHV